jgi:hypothetical protein
MFRESDSPNHDRLEVELGQAGRRSHLQGEVVAVDDRGDVGDVCPRVGLAGNVEVLLGVFGELQSVRVSDDDSVRKEEISGELETLTWEMNRMRNA